MAYATAIATLAGVGLQAFGQFQEGKQTQKAQEFNAQIAEEQAKFVRGGAKLEEFRARKRLKAFTGTQIAKFAKAGVAFTGSPLDVIQDSIANAELDIEVSKFNADIRARGFISEAEQRRLSGRQAVTTGKIGAGATILSGVSDFAQKTRIGQ